MCTNYEFQSCAMAQRDKEDWCEDCKMDFHEVYRQHLEARLAALEAQAAEREIPEAELKAGTWYLCLSTYGCDAYAAAQWTPSELAEDRGGDPWMGYDSVWQHKELTPILELQPPRNEGERLSVVEKGGG